MFATSCVTGFVANRGVCVACPAGAAVCTVAVDGTTTVTSCADGFYSETVSGKV
jgi:hypothetical protein